MSYRIDEYGYVINEGDGPKRPKKNSSGKMVPILFIVVLILAIVLITSLTRSKDSENVNTVSNETFSAQTSPTPLQATQASVRSTPTPIPTANLTQAVNAADHFAYGMDIGHMFAVALRSNGTVVAAGRNDYGQCGVSNWRNIVQVAAGWNFSLGLTSDGHVLLAGTDSKKSPRISESAIAGWNNIVFIAANAEAAAAIDINGTIYVTGGPSESSSVYSIPYDIYSSGRPVAVSVGVKHILVLYDTGKARAIFNENINGCCNVNGWENIVQVAAGDNCSAALTGDGNVLYIGNSNYGNLYGNISNAISISLKGAHLVYLTKDGTVGATGWNKFGQCDVDAINYLFGKQPVAVAASGWNTLVLFSDGSVEPIGSSSNIPMSEVREWSKIVRKR